MVPGLDLTHSATPAHPFLTTFVVALFVHLPHKSWFWYVHVRSRLMEFALCGFLRSCRRILGFVVLSLFRPIDSRFSRDHLCSYFTPFPRAPAHPCCPTWRQHTRAFPRTRRIASRTHLLRRARFFHVSCASRAPGLDVTVPGIPAHPRYAIVALALRPSY